MGEMKMYFPTIFQEERDGSPKFNHFSRRLRSRLFLQISREKEKNLITRKDLQSMRKKEAESVLFLEHYLRWEDDHIQEKKKKMELCL
jgi:hypothetical protein